MKIEHRSDGQYIVTEEKTNKNETIVIKLDSELDNQLICYSVDRDAMKNLSLSWKLRHDEDNGLYIELEATNRLNRYIETSIIDDEACINELVSMVKNSGTLEDCIEIQQTIYESYNKLFYQFLENNRLLHSNIIINGLVEVKHKNNVLGHGTRFIINKDEVTICEYTGKSILTNILPQINIYKDNKKISCGAVDCVNNGLEVFNTNDDIGYIKYRISYSALESTSDIKDIQYPKLKVPYNYTDKENMIQYCKKNNTADALIKYKIALKGKVELLNIDRYMVNEFLI